MGINERTVIITGANSGIGKAAAIRFATAGHQVIMACRNLEKSQKARQDVIDASKNQSVRLMKLDVASFASVRQFCADFSSQYPKLDALIHNAAYFNHGTKTYQISPDGLELTFATNVFGPMLMTELLLDRLAKSDDARILHASSTNLKHFFDPKRAIEFDNLRGEHKDSRPYSTYKMYGDSKMGLLLLTYRMAEAYASRGIKVNALMIPATRLERDSLQKMRSFYRLIGPIIQNLNPWALEPAQIADCYYHICTSDAFKAVTGTLIDSQNEIIPPAEGNQPLSPLATAKELWHTRHTPRYANHPEHIETMWHLGRQVIDQALATSR